MYVSVVGMVSFYSDRFLMLKGAQIRFPLEFRNGRCFREENIESAEP